MPTVVVIGGGVAGLTAALDIASGSPGTEVTVLEGSDRVGGKLRVEQVGGHVVDVGAEAMLALRPEAVDLVERIGAGELLTSPATTAASVWSRGVLHPLPRATLMGLPADPQAARGILSDAEVERAVSERPWEGELGDDVAVGTYIGARLGDAVVDRLVEPLLGGVYAGQPSRLSLRATMPAVWAAATAGDSLTGTAARVMGGARPAPPAARPEPGAPGAARPAAAAPAAAPPRPPFAGIVGGVGLLPGLLRDAAERAGVSVRTGDMVRELRRTGTGWELTVGPTTAPELVEADAVVVAVPPPAASRLLADVAPASAAALGEVEMASSAVITLAVEREGLPELPGSGFLVPPVDGHTIKASTFSANKWGWTGELDPGLVHLRTSVGRAGEEAALQRTDDELVEVSVRELGEALGAPLSRVVDSHVQRWGGGLPQYLVGHLGRVERALGGIAGEPGLELAGAAYDGVGIPAVVASARRAAEAVLGHLSARARMGA